jgi:hypothetical protein
MKFLVRFIYAAVMTTAINQCFAQSTRIEPPRLAVKWSPLHLIYFYPSIQIGIEHKLFQNITLQYDLGLVVDLGVRSNDDFTNCHGFRGIGELRYYIPSPPKIPFYIAGEFYYNNIRFDRSNVIGYDCFDGDCLYYEHITYRVTHDHQGVGLKYGILLFPGWNRNRSFFFDLNVGVAYRSISYNNPGKPIAPNIIYFEDEGDDFLSFRPDEDNRSEFRPVLGFRLGYSFIK